MIQKTGNQHSEVLKHAFFEQDKRRRGNYSIESFLPEFFDPEESEVIVTGHYMPGERTILYDKNMEGHPGSPGYFEIIDVRKKNGEEVDIEFIPPKIIEDWEIELMQKIDDEAEYHPDM